MKPGGKRRIVVPPELGPPVGPATFFSAKQYEVFDVELRSVKTCRCARSHFVIPDRRDGPCSLATRSRRLQRGWPGPGFPPAQTVCLWYSLHVCKHAAHGAGLQVARTGCLAAGCSAPSLKATLLTPPVEFCALSSRRRQTVGMFSSVVCE